MADLYRSIEGLQSVAALRDDDHPVSRTSTLVETSRLLLAQARISELEATLEAERLSVQARINELEATLEAERLSAEARISEMEATLEAERRVSATALADVRVLQNTLSWRLTAPLRAVRKASRHGIFWGSAAQS